MAKIYVSQGHEKSIGLEVFLKSFLLLNKDEASKIHLICLEDTLKKFLSTIKITAHISNNFLKIGSLECELTLIKKTLQSQSFDSLKKGLSLISPKDILLTIPTTKTELKENNIQYTGHTDFFRRSFPESSPVMLFKSENINMALLTEHIQLNQIEESLNYDLIKRKIHTLINSPFAFNKFIFSGVNPHCGEKGLIGLADNNLRDIIKKLRYDFPNQTFSDPISGDTLFCDTQKFSKSDCLISSFHDQGLAPFKALSGIRASNITVGLPFLRLSPDHGTAFDLYGKNKANYYGMLYTIKCSLKYLGLV